MAEGRQANLDGAQPGSPSSLMAQQRAGAFLERLRALLRWQALKPRLVKAAPFLAVVAGFLLVLISLTEVRTVRTVGGLSEFAPPGTTVFEVATTGVPPYALTLAVESCSLEVFPLTPAGFALYEQDGILPAERLDCTTLNATLFDVLSHVVARNWDPTEPILFSLDVRTERLSHPYALASLPGFALVLAGLAALALGMLQRGVDRLRDELEAGLVQERKRKEK